MSASWKCSIFFPSLSNQSLRDRVSSVFTFVTLKPVIHVVP